MHSSMLFAFAVLLISGARGDKQPELPSAATCAAQTSATDETSFLQASRVLKVGSNISDHGLAGNSEKATGDASANEGKFPNGIIPVEAGKSKAILISVVLCHDHPGVALAIAQACSLAKVELWVLTNGPEDCQFGEWDIAPTYIKSEGADFSLYVRDFTPTLTLSAETRKANTILTIPYFKSHEQVQKLETAILAQLRSSYNAQLPHKFGEGFFSEWGALVPDTAGLCTVGSTIPPLQSDRMAKWLQKLGVCKGVAMLEPIDEKTGHADMAMAVAGPHSYLLSYDPKPNSDLSLQAKAGDNRNSVMGMLQKKHEHLDTEPSLLGLPFTYVSSGEPTSYANALVVHGQGGIYLVFPTYEKAQSAKEKKAQEKFQQAQEQAQEQTQEQAQKQARETGIYEIKSSRDRLKSRLNRMSGFTRMAQEQAQMRLFFKQAQEQAEHSWRQALKIDEENVIRVDVSELYEGGGAIHCASKNYPEENTKP